ncbi:unnamed protein product [Adineta steineri]|uniref:Endonuclease/exonuclease/phosphatase domain-containing protein n=1 Tax=Adineta steineri TaxID=433720 RepID=A0A815RHV5_9BILA|nr:unnamed protein product [Adineta steineri]
MAMTSTILVYYTERAPTSLLVCKNKQTYFRFASWNLQQLTNEKVQNPGVREVVCRIILENNFSLIGIQEIGNKEALGYIVEELNNPTIPLIKDWPNRQNGKWNYTVSDAAGRMFQRAPTPLLVCKNKQTYFRFASWNLQQLTNEKVQNPGVREVVCRIILENNFSLIGIQEIGIREAIRYIVEEFNNAIIPFIKDWHNRQNGKRNYTVSDAAGRMFQNLQQLTNEKVQNPSVREVICRIILENNFSFNGIQQT